MQKFHTMVQLNVTGDNCVVMWKEWGTSSVLKLYIEVYHIGKQKCDHLFLPLMKT
jgi:hypothetical protein